MPNFYTPEEANRVLPEVRGIVERIVELRQGIDSYGDVLRSKRIDELGEKISKLEEKGIELKDMSTGLVDFPAIRFGEPVYLCWKLGEEQVLFWHDLKEGFGGRKTLKPELAKIR